MSLQCFINLYCQYTFIYIIRAHSFILSGNIHYYFQNTYIKDQLTRPPWYHQNIHCRKRLIWPEMSLKTEMVDLKWSLSLWTLYTCFFIKQYKYYWEGAYHSTYSGKASLRHSQHDFEYPDKYVEVIQKSTTTSL